jgi:hypothetical protein
MVQEKVAKKNLHRKIGLVCRGCYFCTARQERSDRFAALYKKDTEKYGEEGAVKNRPDVKRCLEKKKNVSEEGAKWRWVRAPHPAFFDSISAFVRWALPTLCPTTASLSGPKQNKKINFFLSK